MGRSPRASACDRNPFSRKNTQAQNELVSSELVFCSVFVTKVFLTILLRRLAAPRRIAVHPSTTSARAVLLAEITLQRDSHVSALERH